MLERNGDELASEAESHEMFEASSHGKFVNCESRGEPWGGPHARLWKRLLAASVKAAGIRVGRFPK